MHALLVLITGIALAGSTAWGQPACVTDVTCSDGNACNGVERCLGGLCRPGTPLGCADSDPCTLDSCDAQVGCQHAAVLNGSSCSDGNVCNGAEVCQGGVCQAGTRPNDGAGCNTGNPCTNNDVCRAGVCQPGTVRPNGAGCGNGNDCDGRETCQQGVCTAGTPASNGTPCGDTEPCNGIDVCVAGACSRGAPPAEGASCSDGFTCNGIEACRSGTCTAGNRPPDGASCSDGNPCNGAELCTAGICRGGTSPTCDDGNRCTVDSCDRVLGCRNTARPEDSSCSDGEPCNGRETCKAGICTPGVVPPADTPCSDGNICNGVESCQGQKCSPGNPLPDNSSCADGNVCDGLERCQGGSCRRGTPLECSDTNPCTNAFCDPSFGCRSEVVANGTSCDDRNVCNGVQTCQTGQCGAATAPLACGALVCDPFAGCVEDQVIAGKKLLLRAGRSASGVNVRAQTRDQIKVSVPPAAGTEADPVLHGGALRLRSVAGGFDLNFELPKQNWEYLRDPADNRGYRYRDPVRDSAIRSVVVKDGRLTKIHGGGPGVLASLATDPNPVEVALILGNQRYCMGFGGETKFEADRRFSAQDAAAPGACPP